MFLDMVGIFCPFVFSLGFFFLLEAKFQGSTTLVKILHRFYENESDMDFDFLFTISHRYYFSGLYWFLRKLCENLIGFLLYCCCLVESASGVLIWNCKYYTVVCHFQSQLLIVIGLFISLVYCVFLHLWPTFWVSRFIFQLIPNVVNDSSKWPESWSGFSIKHTSLAFH